MSKKKKGQFDHYKKWTTDEGYTFVAETKEDALSHNVIAEYQGTELPDEIIVLGGHIDSWDVGQGVMDDGGGCIAAWEAVRLLIENGIRPKRTIRVVLWTNEENGLRGANEYARWVQEDEKSLEKTSKRDNFVR